MWYAEMSGADLEAIVKDVCEKAGSIGALNLVEFWGFLRYARSVEFGASDLSLREKVIRIAVDEHLHRSKRSASTEAAVKNEVDAIVRRSTAEISANMEALRRGDSE
jgi:hypothetical protein